MPTRPATVCHHYEDGRPCHRLAVARGRCAEHARPPWRGSGNGRGASGWAWQRTVARILERDGGVCHLCGRAGAETADHVVALARGGSDHAGNLRAAHRACNQRKARTTDRREPGK